MDSFFQFVVHHWALSGSFALILITALGYEYYSSRKEAKAISTAQAIEQINHFSAVVIDLRSAELFKKGHIIDAIRATASDFDTAKMQAYKDKPLILVCSRGIESQALATKLHKQGFDKVMTLANGMSAWQSANLPLVKK